MPQVVTAQIQDVGTVYIQADSLPVKIDYWQFIDKDDSSFANPDHQTNDWSTIRLGYYYEDKGSLFDSSILNFKGIGWLRQTIHIDSTLKDIPLAFDVEQTCATEIYIDGKLIERYGKINGKDSTEYYTPGEPKLFRLDTIGYHTIAIRFADYHDKEFGDLDIVLLKFSIGNANAMVKDTIASAKFTNMMLALVVGILGMLACLHLLLWLFRTKEIANLFVSVIFAAIGYAAFQGILWQNSNDPDYSLFGDSVLHVLFMIIFWALSGFLNAMFRKLDRRFLYISIISVISIIIGLLEAPYYDEIAYLVALIIMAESVIIVLNAMRKKMKGSAIIGVQVLGLAGTIAIAIPLIIYIDNIDYSSPEDMPGFLFVLIVFTLIALVIAFLGIPITITALLASRYANLNNDLSTQLVHVKELSEKTIAQEQEKKAILENQKHQLETEVQERTKEIVEEKKKSDDLLLNILPAEVAEELKEHGKAKAKHFDEVTVLFTDFVDFTKTGSRLTPEQLVNELDTCFKAFDEIMLKYGIEKIKTIGDAYMAVCGLPSPTGDHAINTVQAAKEIMIYMLMRQKQYPDTSFKIRIGIHSGNVVAGIVGIKKFAYDIWGDTVNTAARMESNSEPNQINISETTYIKVKDKFSCTYRGEIDVKGKGDLKMYFVN